MENNDINEKENNIIASSPKQDQKDFYFNLMMSPEKTTMNQKFFPSKENYFGIKTSPINNIKRSFSPGSRSPILNYYAGLSPHLDNLTCLSPNNDLNINNFNNFSGKLSPNFNYSPSTIFNKQNSNKDIQSNIQNFKSQNSLTEDDYSKTLQEKMAPFVGNTDINNLLKDGHFHQNLNNLDYNRNGHHDDEEDEDNEEAFTLRIDNFSEEPNTEANKQKSPPQSTENDVQKKSSGSIDTNSSIFPNNIELINQNIKLNISKEESNDIINNSSDKESLLKNIINKQEFKPYIPNKYRNLNINNYKNPFEGQANYSYEMSNIQNINTNFINNNIIQNMNFENSNQYINVPNKKENDNNKFSLNFGPQNNNKINKNEYENDNLYNNFYYNGDNYKISSFKEYKKKDYSKTGEIPSIGAADIVTAITANNKKIKRIDPNAYLNESIEYLSYNIFPLAKDQAGCRFLQEKIQTEPNKCVESFYKAILPYILPLSKDPFGNYLIQKLFQYLLPEQIKQLLEIIAPTILDIGSNSHGTRVIQNLINFLSTKELVNYFLNSIKPYTIPLLKELNGTHIINKFINEYPEYADEINKIIIDNCSLLATNRHGCCILQKLLEGPNKKLKNNLINNLIENCFVLIIDQFGNYVIQSILLLNDIKFASAIAMKICDNVPYYSKHRYSSNVIEKCFDFCGKRERKKLIEKIIPSDVISELILDEHGNYVVQKALYYAEYKEKEIILNNIKPIIPKIRNTSFGEKLLYRLYSIYPQLNPNMYNTGENNLNEFTDNNNYQNSNNKKNWKKGKKKKNKNKYDTDENQGNNINNDNNIINNTINNNEVNNNNISLNNYYNINNNTINININSNNENKENQLNIDKNNIVNNHKEPESSENVNFNNNIIDEPKKKKKKKKGKKKKKKIQKNENENKNQIDSDDKIDSNQDNNQNNLDNNVNENDC